MKSLEPTLHLSLPDGSPSKTVDPQPSHPLDPDSECSGNDTTRIEKSTSSDPLCEQPKTGPCLSLPPPSARLRLVANELGKILLHHGNKGRTNVLHTAAKSRASPRNWRKTDPALAKSSFHTSDRVLTTRAAPAVPLCRHGSFLDKGRAIAQMRGSCCRPHTSVPTGTAKMRSAALFNTLYHHAVINWGMTTTCVEFDRLWTEVANHSTAALAAAGGGNHR